MSLPPSSPYKSKLFNFLNRQTIRVKEQVERTVRQAKVAATWGGAGSHVPDLPDFPNY